MVYLLTLLLVFYLVLCNKNGSAVNTTGTRLPLNGTDETSKRTVPRHRAAMDMIMVANNRLKRKHLNEDRIKRMNITGNTTAQEAIIEINEGERIADDLYEGDIIMDPMDPKDFQLIKLKKENKDGLVEETMRKRQASRQLKFLWHNRQVPYKIHSSLARSQNVILEAINKFNQKSCVQFVPYHHGVANYITFTKNDGCSSRVGRAYTTTGEQRISIGAYCDYVPIIIHEMLHAVGFYHEQSRPDRDNYVKILWENIGKVYHTQFLKYTHGDIDRFGIGYNYKSIMHYGKTDFSSGNGDTIQAIQKPQLELGGDVMTPEDIMELDTLYDCNTRTYNSWTSWGSYGPCDTQCYQGRQRYCYGRTPSSCGGNPNAYGIETEYIKCATNECPVRINGHWGRWEAWTKCNSKCNEGSITRVRKCDSPKPGNNGLNCPNSDREIHLCIKPRCTLGKDDTDFRDGQLGSMWLNDVYDTPGFDWLVGKGDTTTEGTGPSKDRYGDPYGYYLYVDSTSRARNDNARLFSHIIPPATGQNKRCLKFYYHMYGATTGSLSVAVYPVGKTSDNIFWKSGNQGNQWHHAQVTLDSSTQFQLVIEASVAGPAYSDIAIDDVFIDKGSCDCQDYYQNCSTWAEDKQCKQSYAFMSTYCKRACNLCGLCKDAMPECGTTWREEQCRTNPAFMEIICPWTCHSCYCYDKHIKCARWKKNGKCNKNRTYMNYYCPKSCGLCS